MRDWFLDHADDFVCYAVLSACFGFLILAVLSLGGCSAYPPALSGVGSGIAAAEAYRDTAFRNAENPSVVRSALGEDGQKRSLREASESLARAEKAAIAEHDARLRAEADLRQERDQWLGDRGKAYFWTIVLSATGVWLGMGLLGTILSVTTGGSSVWAGWIFKLIPLGGLFSGLARRAA